MNPFRGEENLDCRGNEIEKSFRRTESIERIAREKKDEPAPPFGNGIVHGGQCEEKKDERRRRERHIL